MTQRRGRTGSRGPRVGIWFAIALTSALIVVAGCSSGSSPGQPAPTAAKHPTATFYGGPTALVATTSTVPHGATTSTSTSVPAGGAGTQSVTSTTDARCGAGDCNVTRACELLDATAAGTLVGAPVIMDTAQTKGYANADVCGYETTSASPYRLGYSVGWGLSQCLPPPTVTDTQAEPAVGTGAVSFSDDTGLHLVVLHRTACAEVTVSVPGADQHAIAIKAMTRVLAADDSLYPTR